MGAWRKSLGLRLLISLGVAASLGLGMGCATPLGRSAHYDYFQLPDHHDAWSPKIQGWQRRELAEGAPILGDSSPSVAGAGDPAAGFTPAETTDPSQALRAKYADFRAERKREIARDFAAWIQAEAKNHYRSDGPIDHWATLEETLRSNGDDCDGLELLVFHALRDLGFDEAEVYRSIVYRPSDGQHHMVTLWFEDQTDPWVIDPTGAMTGGMRRMSDVPGWVPLKVFSDKAEYSVRRLHDLSRDALAAAELH
ncbi:MAG: hypothetical protein ACQGVK_10625 [Myxococcota bacterium]